MKKFDDDDDGANVKGVALVAAAAARAATTRLGACEDGERPSAARADAATAARSIAKMLLSRVESSFFLLLRPREAERERERQRRGREKGKKNLFSLSLFSLTTFPFPNSTSEPPPFSSHPRRRKTRIRKTMSRLAIICSLVLAALAGVKGRELSQAADWGSAAGNNTAQALANAIARATETAGLKIVSTETAVNNLQKGLNTTAIAAAGVNVSSLKSVLLSSFSNWFRKKKNVFFSSSDGAIVPRDFAIRALQASPLRRILPSPASGLHFLMPKSWRCREGAADAVQGRPTTTRVTVFFLVFVVDARRVKSFDCTVSKNFRHATHHFRRVAALFSRLASQ